VRWQEIIAAGAIALVSSLITAGFGIYLDRARERERRKGEISALIIDTFSRLNRLAETCVGLYGTLAASVENPRYASNVDALRTQASEALNDAWYASRDLDVVLPSAEPLTTQVRRHLREYADVATEHHEAGSNSQAELQSLGDVRELLDGLAAVVRRATGHQRVVGDL